MDRDGVKALVLSRGEEVHQIGGCMGKMDKLGYLVGSHLSGRKDYTENVESLRAMLDSIPTGTPTSISLDPGLRTHLC